MPDGRFLSKSIAYSAQVGSVSLEADYLFMRMIPHLDSAGRMTGEPMSVKALCCPLRNELTVQIAERCLSELCNAGLIDWYVGPDKAKYLSFPGFKAHQRGARLEREAPSRLPEASEANSTTLRTTPENSGEWRVSEVKRSEVKESKDPRRAKRERVVVENWVSRLAAVFREKGGTVSEGHLGKAMKGAHEKYGEDVLKAAMVHWLTERKQHGWSCAFSKFAVDYVRWCEDVVALRAAVDSGMDYWDNETLQRLTRPTMVA